MFLGKSYRFFVEIRRVIARSKIFQLHHGHHALQLHNSQVEERIVKHVDQRVYAANDQVGPEVRFGDCDKLANERSGPVPTFGVRTDAICFDAQVVGVFGAPENMKVAAYNCCGEVTAGSRAVACRHVAACRSTVTC